MNLYDGVAFIALAGILIGAFYMIFKKGRRLKGAGASFLSFIALFFAAFLSVNQDAKDAGFSSYADKQLAEKAGISNPQEFESKKAELLAEKAKRNAEAKRQKEQEAAEAERLQVAKKAKDAEEEAKQKALIEKEKAFYLPPEEQTKIVQIVKHAAEEFRNANNDLAKGGIRRDRARAICSVKSTRRVQGWIGTLAELTTNSDGLGVVAISLSDELKLTTMNNVFSDINSNTLIDPDKPIFKKLSALKEGDKVKVYGDFVRADIKTDCFWEISMTMAGSMTQPEFIFRFSDIEVFSD
ncbi:MAG: hypothetical protein OIF58_01540 [Cohaesibacter sp.]|nr:hypothetical protein [Cohaesibacter sp.]